jgi:hypothetical protein
MSFATLIKSIRGRDKLCDDEGYIYRFNKSCLDRSHWSCDQHDRHGCKARITTNTETVQIWGKKNLHNHDYVPGSKEAAKVTSDIMNLSTSTEKRPRDVLATAFGEGVQPIVAAHLPTQDALKQKIRRARIQQNPVPPAPDSRGAIHQCLRVILNLDS